MAITHEGLASLVVDLHEVDDILALTNSLVQLHNLVGGSQVTLTNLGDTTVQKVIDGVLMMNSLLHTKVTLIGLDLVER